MAKNNTSRRGERRDGGEPKARYLRKHRAPGESRLTSVTRREFLAYSAGTGMLFAGSPLLQACGSDDDGESVSTEQRTYLFNLSHIDTSAHDVVLVAGRDRIILPRTTPEVLTTVRRDHPIFARVPDEHITHHFTGEWPAQAIQLCYLQRISHHDVDGRWDMAFMFYHLPMQSTRQAHARLQALRREGIAAVSGKWARYGTNAVRLLNADDAIGENMLKDCTDHATALVAGHPELSSGEPNSAAHIQGNIIATQSSTTLLAEVIESQGPATPSGGWATQRALIDQSTGQPYRNSQGQIQYMPQWSQLTSQFAGMAITPALTTAKNDTTLGSNVSDIDPESIEDNDETAPTNGAVWTLHDGMPTVDQSMDSEALRSEPFTFQLTNQSPDHGYSAKVLEVDNERFVTIQLKNWYVRHLGFYLRYLDAAGNPIAASQIKRDLDPGIFPLSSLGLDSEFDIFVYLVNPQMVVLGMPVSTTTVEYTFPMPEEAASVLILNGGLGRGSDPYPSTLIPGLVMTVLFELAVPSIFLALAAAPGFPRLQKELQAFDTILWVLQLSIEFFEALFTDLTYDEPAAFADLAPEIGEKLLDKGAERLDELIAEAIAEGEAIEAVEDAIPVIGTFLAAISAVGLVAQITETSVQVAQSPRTYATKLTFTHDLAVTIAHDPNDPSGFPAVARYLKVTAQFDDGSPYVMRQDMPDTTVTEPITVTLKGVPFGGHVSVHVGFYSENDWLAGQGSVGPVDNISTAGSLDLDITITENLVPLEPDTVYSHKEIIVLNAAGDHEWMASASPPAVQTVQGQCESTDGQLCMLNGITVSTVNAAVGYSWQAYNSQVRNCENDSVSQQHQFANISVTQNPQSEYLFSGCGFSGVTRVVYDLLGKQDFNFYLDPNKSMIRQIRLSGATAAFDGPDSNMAWGKLQFASDAMLLHPAGRIISINRSANKIEVVQLSPAAVADDDAPLSQVYAGSGIREGLLDGPTLAALTPDGSILILETANNRIQAFDLGANPVPQFMEDSYFVPLLDQPTGYLDLAVEYTGYMYVLSYTGQTGSLEFRLDIYTPQGEFLSRTTGFNAAKVAVNYWRDLFALNYQALRLPNNSLPARTEPSVSHWIPSTPSVDT